MITPLDPSIGRASLVLLSSSHTTDQAGFGHPANSHHIHIYNMCLKEEEEEEEEE
jgi:hypothetical protein